MPLNDKLQNLQEHQDNIAEEDTKKPKAKLTKKMVIILAVVALLIILSAILFNSIFDSQNNTAIGALAGANMGSGQNNMYMEEEVVLSNIIVGVTEMGSSSLISNNVSYEFQTTILEVVAKPGEFVQQGDIIAYIDTELFEDEYDAAMSSLESAKLSLSQEQLNLQTTSLTASQTYEDSITNGENAQNVYNLNIAELENGYLEIVADITSLDAQKVALEKQIETVNLLNTELVSLNNELSTIQALIATAQTIVSDPTIYDPTIHIDEDADNDGDVEADDVISLQSEETVKKNEITKKEAEIQTAEDSQQSGSSTGGQSLEDQLALLVVSISQKNAELDTYVSSMDMKRVEYYQEYERSMQTYNSAGTQYNISMQTASNKIDEVQLEVQELQAEVDALTQLAADGTVIATTSGYILSIQDEGATVNANGTIANIAESTIANVYVSIPQEDISDVEIDMAVNIVFDAYEDYIVTAVVDSISLTPSGGISSSVNYTVGIEVDVSAFDGMVIFEGMTADVTFVEKQVLDVLVVSNKCVEVIDGKQYVLMYNENREVIQTEVTTGFSDGFDVEIISGLKEGDIVLIESAVSQNAA